MQRVPAVADMGATMAGGRVIIPKRAMGVLCWTYRKLTQITSAALLQQSHALMHALCGALAGT